MKKSLVCLSVLFLIISCNSTSNDPTSTLKNFLEALSKKDIQGAKEWVTTDSEAMLSMLEMGLKMAPDSADQFYEVTNASFGEAVIDGSTARVPVTDKTSGEEVTFTLKKESGDWKVAFDKATIMQMATDKMKEKGVQSPVSPDSLVLPEISEDSVRNMLENMSENEREALRRGLDSASGMLEDYLDQRKNGQ